MGGRYAEKDKGNQLIEMHIPEFPNFIPPLLRG